MPQAIAIGMTIDEFWDATPRTMKIMSDGHMVWRKEQDEMDYMRGSYYFNAVQAAIMNVLPEKKGRSKKILKYEDVLPKPYLADEVEKTDEDIEREIQKAILVERQWINSANNSGLPETVIKI